MSTTYHPFKIALTDGQKKKLQKAYVTKMPVGLKVKPDQIGRGDELLLTETQIKRLKKRSAAGKGMVIKLSKTQIQNTAQRGGNLFSAMLCMVQFYVLPCPPGHTPGDLQFCSHLAVYSPPPGTQKETIPHPRDSSSTTNTLFCVQSIDFRTTAKPDVLIRT